MNRFRLIGNLLLAAGLVCLVLAGLARFTDLFAGDRVLPQPIALAGGSGDRASVDSMGLEDGTATPETEALPSPVATATAEPTAVSEPSPAPTETVLPTPSPTPAKPGVPIRMVVPSIGVDSRVEEAGTFIVAGQQYWTTLPFVVAHYNTTARAGAKGNAVFSGHVTSRNAGNVFNELYRVGLGDEVKVYTKDGEFTYVVTRVRLVAPDDIAVMDPTIDATATLITCAGEWNPTERSYSQRLIVTAKLKR
jgi:LPXTG-site transpeptidase (sortase) family protein